jgi:hypothetical protein
MFAAGLTVDAAGFLLGLFAQVAMAWPLGSEARPSCGMAFLF